MISVNIQLLPAIFQTEYADCGRLIQVFKFKVNNFIGPSSVFINIITTCLLFHA